ncbi:MAG: hypothetical protein V4804_07975 [Pseudomonadota bacterium]
MSDPNMQDFYGRISRIERAHSQGYGFEAEGTLGRSAHRARRARRRMRVVPFIFLIGFAFGMKGALHYHAGADNYDARVAELQTQAGFDGFVGAVMQSEPITRYVSAKLHQFVGPRA